MRQVLLLCGSLVSSNNDTRTHSPNCALTAIQSLGVAVERRVVTHRLTHASRRVREAASRLMRPRKGHADQHQCRNCLPNVLQLIFRQVLS